MTEPDTLPYRIVSVDDHLIEPPDLFDGRMPAALAERAPHIVTGDDGRQAWVYEGGSYPNIGLNAVIGRPKHEWSMEPANFDEMRRGCWDIDARVQDMDLAGIEASVCFPSLIAGFSGAVFARSQDPVLGEACVRAWNAWHHEVWAGTHPGRMIPTQITWLADPLVAAAMVRENAELGFRALSFAEFPSKLGLPSLHGGHWDPLLAACEETETVVCLHTGSSSWAPVPSDDPPFELLPTLFETTSAFGTVGLSMGEAGAPVSLVGHFSGAGKALVIAMMFMGRIGPLTLAVAIARRGELARVRHPEGKFLIG